jgi:hypothetical protein
MKTLGTFLILITGFITSSFKMADDTTCYINYSGVDSQGCTTTVVGTYDCNSATPISTFSGTITLGGDGNCLNAQVISCAAQPSGDDWTVPTGYQVAFYSDRMDNFCQSTTLTFIGYNSAVVGALNKISRPILNEFLSDMGC